MDFGLALGDAYFNVDTLRLLEDDAYLRPATY